MNTPPHKICTVFTSENTPTLLTAFKSLQKKWCFVFSWTYSLMEYVHRFTNRRLPMSVYTVYHTETHKCTQWHSQAIIILCMHIQYTVPTLSTTYTHTLEMNYKCIFLTLSSFLTMSIHSIQIHLDDIILSIPHPFRTTFLWPLSSLFLLSIPPPPLPLHPPKCVFASELRLTWKCGSEFWCLIYEAQQFKISQKLKGMRINEKSYQDC